MEKSRRKIIFAYVLSLSLILATLMILNSSFTSAQTATLNAPVAGGNFTGTITVNGSINQDKNFTVAHFYYNSTGGNASLPYGTLLLTITNTSTGQQDFTSTGVSISSLSDLATYNFTVIFGNATVNFTSVGTGGITIDNTNPTCTASVRHNVVEQLTSQTLSCSCSDGLDSSPTITRTLTKPSANTVSPTATPYSATGTDINEIGRHLWDCSATDYTSNSFSASQLSFSVETTEDLTPAQIRAIERGGQDISTGFIVIAGASIVVIISTIVIMTSSSSRKKRRR